MAVSLGPSRQANKRLKTFHMRSLRHILRIMWSDRVPNTEVLTQAGNQSMFTLLMQRGLRWLGHLHRIADGKIFKAPGYHFTAQVVHFLNCARPK